MTKKLDNKITLSFRIFLTAGMVLLASQGAVSAADVPEVLAEQRHGYYYVRTPMFHDEIPTQVSLQSESEQHTIDVVYFKSLKSEEKARKGADVGDDRLVRSVFFPVPVKIQDAIYFRNDEERIAEFYVPWDRARLDDGTIRDYIEAFQAWTVENQGLFGDGLESDQLLVIPRKSNYADPFAEMLDVQMQMPVLKMRIIEKMKESDLYMPVSEKGQVPLIKQGEGEEAVTALAVFSSYEAYLNMAEGLQGFALSKLDGKDVLKKFDGRHVLLNPGSKGGLLITPEDFKDFLKRKESPESDGVQIDWPSEMPLSNAQQGQS